MKGFYRKRCGIADTPTFVWPVGCQTCQIVILTRSSQCENGSSIFDLDLHRFRETAKTK